MEQLSLFVSSEGEPISTDLMMVPFPSTPDILTSLPQSFASLTGKGDKGNGKNKGNKSGSGLSTSTDKSTGLYQMDTEGAMNRLTLLIGGKKAGNTSQAIKQEAATILDWLLNNNKINVEEHKLLTQEIKS